MSAKERSKRYRQKIKQNKQTHDQYKQNERKRWSERKQEGKIKTIGTMTRREQKLQRQKWREASRAHVQKKAMVAQIDTPPSTPTRGDDDQAPANDLVAEAIPGPSRKHQLVEPVAGPIGENRKTDGRRTSGRKRTLRHRSETSRKLKEANIKLGRQQALINRYRVQINRLKTKVSSGNDAPQTPETPRRKVQKLLRGLNADSRVRKQLVRQQAAIDDMMSSKCKNKRIRLLSLATIKKYKMRTWLRNKHKIDIRSLQTGGHRGNKHLSTLVRSNIEEFYERDDVSRMTAGRHETVTKHKIKKQRRYLKDTMVNLHKKYNESNPRFRVSRATFYKFKPFWVLKPKVDNRETVECQRCSNLQFMVNCLFQYKLVETINLQELVTDLYCKVEEGKLINEECLDRTCHRCAKNQPPIKEDVDLDKRVSWWKWENDNIDVAVRRDNTGPSKVTRVTKKSVVYGTLQDLVDDFINDLTERGARHTITYQHQARVLRDLKSKLRPNDMLVHIDFSENYACKYSTEVQSMHFGASREQVTIHDGVIYIGSDYVKSFCSLSNSPRHDPVAVWSHLMPVLSWVLSEHPNVDSVHFMSDGPVTQYRCKTNFYLFSKLLVEEFPRVKNATWNFTGAAHGKGASDGVGAAIKRRADTIVANGRDIPNAATMFKILLEQESKVQLFYIPARDIEEADDDVPLKIQTLQGTMKFHQIRLESRSKLKHRNLGCFCKYPYYCDCYEWKDHTFETTKQPEAVDDNISVQETPFTDDNNNLQQLTVTLSTELVGTYCLVLYDDEPYVGHVMEYNEKDDDITVKAMVRRGGNLFNWPVADDIARYPQSSVITTVTEPKKKNNHRHFSLLMDDWSKYQALM